MNWFRRLSYRAMGACLGFVVGGGVIAMPDKGSAKEFYFVIRDVENEEAVWFPREVIIHRSTDFAELLTFRFENPTARTHVFEAPALFESVEEGGGLTTRPVRITISTEETAQTVIDRDRLANDALNSEGGTVSY
ncbi:MAG: hypothetical protein EWM72_02127 [Nitrospira sp.]|nr:MAG: hypothetical protein EWM72_02127 [Nitrospira sp.]